MFFCEFCEVFKNTFFYRITLVAASVPERKLIMFQEVVVKLLKLYKVVSYELSILNFTSVLIRSQAYKTGNVVNGQISKLVLQENKAREIFRKMNISCPLIRTRVCVYQGVRNVRFSENFTRFVFCSARFEIHPFLSYYRRKKVNKISIALFLKTLRTE